MATWVSVDPEHEARMLEEWKAVAEEAARLTGWPVADVEAVRYNGMGPRTNARVWRRDGVYMDVKMPDHML